MAAIVTTEDALYALDLVRNICDTVGPGMPGTPQERQRAAMIRDELAKHLGAPNVVVEEFRVAPWAMLSGPPLMSLLLLVAALLNVGAGRSTGAGQAAAAVGALILAILAPVPFIFLFLRNREWLDRFFQQRTSVNVIGALRKPGADAKRLLILGGHHDSAPENTWIGLLGRWFMAASGIAGLGFVVVLVASAVQVAGIAAGNAGLAGFGTLGWAALVFLVLPSVLFGVFFNRGKRGGGTVPGAADNLSACAVVTATARFFAQNPDMLPDDTEVRFISFGCEEAGLRGSRRYVERHLDELKRLDARVLNYEVLVRPQVNILTSDMNGTVKNSPAAVRGAVEAAERAGAPYKVRGASLGEGSDAGPFSEAGLRACTLLGMQMPEDLAAFYHQKRDTPEVLSVEALANVLKITVEWVRCGGE